MQDSFELWPAIDLLEGKPVRLLKGDYDQKTDYSKNFSLEHLAEAFSSFATGIHLVDLDGARSGKSENLDAIKKIVQVATIPVEVGGGIRSQKDIERLLETGVSRVILGTKAIDDPDFLREMLQKFGTEKVVLGLDAREGVIATHGWESSSGKQVDGFLVLYQEMKGKHVIFTDITRDGTLEGPALLSYEDLSQKFSKLSFIASGGVSNMSDITALKKTGAKGVIFGKAFYEGKILLEEFVEKKISKTSSKKE